MWSLSNYTGHDDELRSLTLSELELELGSEPSAISYVTTGNTTIYFDPQMDPRHPANTDRRLNRNILRHMDFDDSKLPAVKRLLPIHRYKPYYTRSLARERAIEPAANCPVCLVSIEMDAHGEEQYYRPDLIRDLGCGHRLHRQCLLDLARQLPAPVQCPECRSQYSLTKFLDFARPF